MLDRADIALGIVPGPVLPIRQMVLGRPVSEVVALLPRVFNLCRMAQEGAARLAFGLDLPPGWTGDLAQEIARDHALLLGLRLPARLGLAPLPVAQGDLAQVFGVAGFPDDPDGFQRFLTTGTGIAPVLAAVDRLFAPGVAVADALPPVGARPDGALRACENSVAARHAGHPVMRHLAQTRGRGPLWRLVGRALDLRAALVGDLPAPQLGAGWAAVPAARGLYTVSAQAVDGHVTAFDRRTPTDHLLAPGGILRQSLDSLPVDAHARLPLLLDILDPCSPVTVSGGPGDA
ncbi:hydrogenase expression/formation protein HupK [Actibacterium ureilyticum]|uniref:hydrogenase expression/formation protein HupK n=1 Tax=Actibacterium ureilyticum TaxID=1590614 RepID=UPI000BAAAB2A|nr:hydrogenase expression/formation protein HupK [Actibacterium ureilyticum]